MQPINREYDLDSTQESLRDIAEGYLTTLTSGDSDGLFQLLGAGAVIEDPRHGRVAGEEGLRQFVRHTQRWLEPQSSRVDHLRSTVTAERVCSEDILHLFSNGEKIELPVGTVVSRDKQSEAIALHVYYTNWPFYKRHSVRPALFTKPAMQAEHTDVILKYFESLVNADIETTMSCFEADIYFREASGPPYIHWGANAVRDYFMGLFSQGAPMLRDDTIIDDGRCAVMEFTVVGWNGKHRDSSTQEAGLAVYERSEDGLIRAIRIYDDVDFEG